MRTINCSPSLHYDKETVKVKVVSWIGGDHRGVWLRICHRIYPLICEMPWQTETRHNPVCICISTDSDLHSFKTYFKKNINLDKQENCYFKKVHSVTFSSLKSFNPTEMNNTFEIMSSHIR